VGEVADEKPSDNARPYENHLSELSNASEPVSSQLRRDEYFFHLPLPACAALTIVRTSGAVIAAATTITVMRLGRGRHDKNRRRRGRRGR
jgi:hypothetical protein